MNLPFFFLFLPFSFVYSPQEVTLSKVVFLSPLLNTKPAPNPPRPVPPQSVGITRWDQRYPRSLPGADPNKRGFARPWLHLLPHSGSPLWYVSLIRFLDLWISTSGCTFVSSVRTIFSWVRSSSASFCLAILGLLSVATLDRSSSPRVH